MRVTLAAPRRALLPLLLLLLLPVLPALLPGAAHATRNGPHCTELYNKSVLQNQGEKRDAVVSVKGVARGVTLLWGAAPARAGAALLGAVLAAALRYRVSLARSPHRLVDLASNTSLLEYKENADYSELALVVSAAWSAAERGAPCRSEREDECGVSGPRLREFGGASIPAHARLHARLAPASPRRSYIDAAWLTDCRFRRAAGGSGDAGPALVYFPAEEEEPLAEIATELERRAAAASLRLRLRPLRRSELFRELRSTNDSFMFLDYDVWQGEAGVWRVAPPPCADDSSACREELDPSVALRAVDSTILTRYSPRLFDAFHRFYPKLPSLRAILEYEATEGLTVEEAACKWANQNPDSFHELIKETVNRSESVEYLVLVFLCENDIDVNAYHLMIRDVLASEIAAFNTKNYYILISVKNVSCDDPKGALKVGDSVMSKLEGKKVIGLVAGGEGADLAAFAARRLLPLVLYDAPADGIDAGAAGSAAAWSSAGRLRPLAQVVRHLAASLGWRRLAVVSDATAHATDLFAALNDGGPDLALGDFRVRAGASEDEAASLLRRLRDANARVVFVNAGAAAAAAILSAAVASDMMRDEYAWIVRDWSPGKDDRRARVVSVSYWWRGDGAAPAGSGSPKLRKKLNRLWGGREWPARAAALADAMLTLAYGFKEAMSSHDVIIEYDLHTEQIIKDFKAAMANRSARREGVLQELDYDSSTRARARPLVFVDRWSGARRSALGGCRVEGARVECDLRPPYPGGAPADGASRCLARTGGDPFSPGCLDAAWISALALVALAAPVAYVTRRAVLRRLARRDRRLLLQLLARRERVSSALAAHLTPRAALELREELGAGRFGRVHLALLRSSGRTRVVAAKSLREGAAPAEESEFLREACTLSALEHEHVVRLVGVCADDGPPLVLMEHAFFGDLLRYLRARRHLAEAAPEGAEEAVHVAPEALTRLAREAASALGYLALRGLVHRDVRAANCLVDARRSLKLADFGMARETAAAGADGAAEYACRRRALFPVLWMAPESLARGVFSAASDVWALGVLALELVTLGERPYGDMSPLRVLQFVVGGGRPPLPPDTTPQTRGVVLACWQREAEQRPTAPELVSYLAAHPRALRPALRAPRVEPTDADSGYGEPSSPDLLRSDGFFEALD